MNQSTQVLIIEELIGRHKSLREFARKIGESPSDMVAWKYGRRLIIPRAVIKIAKLYGINPNTLRPDIFPEGIKLIFK